MIKKHWLKLLLASVVTVLPCTIGVILWEQLPENMATHFGVSGEADGYASKAFAVFGLPLILLAAFWFCVWASSKDAKNKDQNSKAFGAVIWLMPLISWFANGITYYTAFGKTPDLMMLFALLFGAMFMLIGNYMPKCKQNFTLGIKIKPTLESEENWNATHRVAGKVWFFGGMLILFCAFLPESIGFVVVMGITFLFVIIPIVYSYWYRNQQKKDEKNDIKSLKKNTASKVGVWITAIVVPLILIFVAVLMFTGDVQASIEGDKLIVGATYWTKSEIPLDQLHHIQYTEQHDDGMRVSGFQSAKLQLGIYQNDLYGTYTMYAYSAAKFHVLINDGDRVLVLSLKDEDTTKAFYEQLLEVVG